MRQHDSKLRLTVLGATGATGRHVVEAALGRGHEVTVVVRQSGAFPPNGRLIERVWTDLTDQVALTSFLGGADAVISTLGGAAKGPTTVCTDAARALIPAMASAGVSRLVAVSAHGVAETHDRSLFALAAWAGVADRLRDKETMEALITHSDLTWTIVRPPALKDTSPVGRYQVGVDFPIRLWSSIGRADLAGFLVAEVEQPRFTRAFPRLRG